MPNHITRLSTRAGFGADGRGRKRSRLRALVPSTGRQLRRLSQKIVFNSSRQRGKNSLSPCHSPHLSTPTSATTFSLLTSNQRKEEALRPRLIIHLVTTLPGPGIGRNGNLESVAKRFCLICSPSSANFKTMFGGGTWEGGSCEEKNADSAGNRGSPLNGCLGEEGRVDEKASPHHPCLSPSR